MAVIKSLRIMMLVDSSRVKRGVKKTEQELAKSRLNLIGRAAMIAVGYKFGQTVTKGIAHAMAHQRFEIELANMTPMGRKLFKQLKDAALQSPFSIEEWMLGGKRLLASGVEAERVTHIMKMLGDMSAATGSSVNELALVFGQVFAKGRLQGEEVLQFMERGISLNKALMKTLGVTKSELQRMQEAGEISPEDVIKAMEAMTSGSGIFSGMMDAALSSASGMLAVLRNIWENVLAKFGKILLPAVGFLLKQMAGITREGGLIEGFMDVFGVAIANIAMTIGTVLWLMNKLHDLTGGWATYVIGVALAFTSIAVAIAFIKSSTALMGVLTAAWNAALTVASWLWGIIAAEVTVATGSLNLLIAALVVAAGLLITIAGAFGFRWLADSLLDGFEKAKDEAKEMLGIAEQAGSASSGPTGARFGTRSFYDMVVRGSNRETQQQQLIELQKIRANQERAAHENARSIYDMDSASKIHLGKSVANFGFRGARYFAGSIF